VRAQTNVGTILISVNPFKRLPLYTPTVMDQYMHKGVKEMPPHTFNIADNAYK
jgi:myosin heavy subunit